MVEDYEGKQAVLDDLLRPLSPSSPTVHQHRATLHCRRRLCGGGVPRPRHHQGGKAYNNVYCWVCRIADGKLES